MTLPLHTPLLQWLYQATWLWLPLLLVFLVQSLRCSLPAKLVVFKIGVYYIVSMIALNLLLPTSHLRLRILLVDLVTRTFLFLQAAEILWINWNSDAPSTMAISTVGALKQQELLAVDEDESDQTTRWMVNTKLIGYAALAFFYLAWMILGLMFAFTLTPGL